MTNKSQVLALKYRPQTFQDFVGHEEVSNSIFNAIKLNRSTNAYLFTGIRGIGKTTFARVVAKALNCKNGVSNLCKDNFCSNCESIINSNHIDVLEIDAASKTGVDDVRELIEFSKYSPSIAKYKVFIIDEVHMLSKQAFNALLKTLEEPPNYLKFIFATTEIKKVPITIISRCQRYDLSRIKAEHLFDHLKNIVAKEKKKIEDNALRLIVKISEGSVRDALSLLDRALISSYEDVLTFVNVQKIFGYSDKSSFIDLLDYIFQGEENVVLDHYRKIYDKGLEPNIFLNDFLEIIYYIKNIKYIKVDGKSFSLNDNEYNRIKSLSKKLSAKDIFLFWEFTLKTIKEINIVSNPNLSIEMFLTQMMYLANNASTNNIEVKETKKLDIKNTNNLKSEKIDSVNQIKNFLQEEEKIEDNTLEKLSNLDDLIKMCIKNKEMKLKYDLENHVNLVSFYNKRIEISFNEKLSKNFVKDLSEKLFLWTNDRWIISFSKKEGQISKKEQVNSFKEKVNKDYKNSKDYKKLKELLPDLELIEVKNKND